MPASPPWHLRGRDLNQPGLSEPELRLALLKLDKNRLEEYEVRHGRGDWNPADKVLDLYRLLARNGCYIRIGRRVEGPFTVTRAMQLIKEELVDLRKHTPHEQIRVRVGRKSQWIKTREFVSQYGDRSRQAEAQSTIHLASTTSPELTDAAFESTSDFHTDVDMESSAIVSQEMSNTTNSPTTASSIDVESTRQTIGANNGRPNSPPPTAPDQLSQSISDTATKPNRRDGTIAEQEPAPTVTPKTEPSSKKEAERSAPPLIPPEGTPQRQLPAPRPGRAKRTGTTSPIDRSTSKFYQYEAATKGVRSPHRTTSLRRWYVIATAICLAIGAVAYLFAPTPNGVNKGTTLAINWADASSSPEFEDPGTAKEPAIVTDGVPPRFLFRSRFRTAAGVAKGGVAFAARKSESSDPVLVSAMRLLGPLGGLEKPVNALDLFASLQTVDLQDCQSGRVHRNIEGNALIIPGAKAFPASSVHGDVFAFQPDKALALTPLQVSNSKAWAGERAWIPSSQPKLSLCFHPAKIVTNQDGRLVLEIEKPIGSVHSIDWVVGAPVINSANEIIGVVSVSQTKGNRCRLLATPAVRFVDYL